MKTLLVILALVVSTSMGVNAQTQTKSKTPTTTQAKSQPKAQAQAQPQAQSKTMMKIAELPKLIQDNLATQFKGWTPTQAYKLDMKGLISYEVMVRKEASETRLFYDKDGKFMKEEPMSMMKSEPKKETTPAKQGVNKAPAPKPANKPK